VLSKLAVGVRVVGDGETQRKEHEREGDQEETRHRVLACVPSEYRLRSKKTKERGGLGKRKRGA
jgi:hypothetical protein